MPYSESKKLTEQEKRLKALREQLFGKQRVSETVKHTPQEDHVPSASGQTTHESSFLKRDLTKILFLSSLIILAQALLFLGLKQGLVHF